MSTDPLTNPELPSSVRDLVKASIEQAKQAFDTFVSTNEKTWNSLENSTLATAQSLRSLNEKIADITRKNADANFQLAIELSEAQDTNHAVELQNQHARRQMQTFSSQLEEIRDLAVQIVLEANAPTGQRPPGAGPSLQGGQPQPSTLTPPRNTAPPSPMPTGMTAQPTPSNPSPSPSPSSSPSPAQPPKAAPSDSAA